MHLLKLPKRASLVDVVFEELERMILSGELKPGSPINEKALSEKNGLSRAPIREACRRLEQAGLVEIPINRGVFVRKISRRDAEELCAIRSMMADYAARLAAKAATPAQLRRIRTAVGKIEQSVEAGDIGEYYRLNESFHTLLIEASGNQRLVDIYVTINKELSLYRWRAVRGTPDFRQSLAEHRAILDALLARDADALARCIGQHLEAVNRRLLAAGLAETESDVPPQEDVA